jgi:putative transposase
MEPRKPYPTDLSDPEWALLQPYVPETKRGGRPEKYPQREMLHAIFSIVRGGCAWRLLPHDFPPWQMVYHDFWVWRQDGSWPHIHDRLRGDVRVAAGRHRQPSAGSIASQSVKTTEKGGSTGTMRTSTSTAANISSSSIREGYSWW